MSGRRVGLVLGPAVFVGVLLAPGLPDLEPEARAAAAVACWMAVWWITEAVPIPATALLPIVLFPVTGVVSPAEVTRLYGHQLIFLFLGGFLLSLAIQKWNLHRRLALGVILLFGMRPRQLILGFMAATAFLSMWISNTATTLMMVPIGLGIIHQVARLVEKEGLDIDTRPGNFHFGMALMLGIAYSASVGGLGTIIGSPPNAIFVGYVDEALDRSVSFLDWMAVGLPISILGLALAWLYLAYVAYPPRLRWVPGGTDLIREELAGLGQMGREERRVLAIFVLMASLWVGRGLLEGLLLDLGVGEISDTTVAILGGLLFFLVGAPSREGEGLLVWEDLRELPWGVLILFGGGLALARGIEDSGLAAWLAERLAVLEAMPLLVMIGAVVALVVFLTEITSNTATATIFMPVMAGLGTATGVDPFLLMLPAAVAASCAFMLPVATPPNAVVFGSGYVSMRQMMKAGIWLNLIFVVFLSLVTYFWVPRALDLVW